jgi:ABC-type glycerol-3-phosphate transport system substrate-binding protein
MERMIRRRYLGGSAALLGGLLAAACGEPTVRYVGQPQAGPAGPAGPQGAKGATGQQGVQGAAGASGKDAVVVTYVSNLNFTHPESIARYGLLDMFNKTTDLGITVNFDDQSKNVSHEQIRLLAAAGTPPDMGHYSHIQVGGLFVDGVTIDLEPILKVEPDWAAQRADFYERMLGSSMWAGKLVSIPAYANNDAFIYNKGLLDQRGIPYPKMGWTWDDLIDMATKASIPGEVWGVSWYWTRWYRFVGTNGGRVINDDGSKMLLDSPENVEVLEFLLHLVQSGLSPADGMANFYKKALNDVVFEQQGPYRMPTLRKNNAPDFGVTHHPIKTEIFANSGGHNLIVTKGTSPERQHAAALVSKWITATPQQTEMVIKSTGTPVSKSVVTDPVLIEYLKSDPQLKGFIDLSPYSWRWPPIPSMAQTYPKVRDCGPVMRGEIGVKDWLAEQHRVAQLLLDKHPPV